MMKKFFSILLIVCLLAFASKTAKASLTFGAATTDRVAHGSGTSLDSLPQISILMWIYPTTLTASRRLYSKRTSSELGIDLRIASTTSELRFLKDRSGADTIIDYITSSAPLVVNTWTFIAVTGDTSVTTNTCFIYKGTLTASAAECTYGTANNGTGTSTRNENPETVYVGNHRAFASAWQGRIAVCAVFNRILSLGEIKSFQFQPRNLSGCVLFTYYGFGGTGTQPDGSGNGNNGTVTGATVSDHVPLRPFVADLWDHYQFEKFTSKVNLNYVA